MQPQTGRYEAPGISTGHYILKRIDAAEAERLLAAWTAEQVFDEEEDSAEDETADSGDSEAPLQAIAIDGKVLRGSYDRDLDADGQPRDKAPQQQLSALEIHSGTVVGQLGFTGQQDDAEGAALRQLVETVRGANAILALRCSVLSGNYEDFWAERAENPPIQAKIQT